MKKNIVLVVFVIIVIAIGGWLLYNSQTPSNQQNGNATSTLIAEINYLCDQGKTITASYYQGAESASSTPGEPPTPTGSVNLILSDKRQIELPQTISASGIRYANTDESFIFWSKGNGCFITENESQTYVGCIAVSPDIDNLAGEFASSSLGFSIRYPEGYSVNTTYKYQALGPGKDISGIKFIIPTEIATNTNLSSYDTGVSVEQLLGQVECSASLFALYTDSTSNSQITDNGVDYLVASTSDAGAGNFYEETIWAIPGTSPCIAVRYLIHSTNIGNYPPGTVIEFDKQALLEQFNQIRRSINKSQ